MQDGSSALGILFLDYSSRLFFFMQEIEFVLIFVFIGLRFIDFEMKGRIYFWEESYQIFLYHIGYFMCIMEEDLLIPEDEMHFEKYIIS